MVKLSLSFLSTATAFAVTSAAPFFDQEPFTNRQYETPPKRCLPDTDINVYESFLVRNHALNNFISMSHKNPFVLGGDKDDEDLSRLVFNLVSLHEEDPVEATEDCILEDVDYLFHITAPFHGYLRGWGKNLEMVSTRQAASPFYFHKSAGQGLRIAQITPEGPLAVATDEPGTPLLFERPESKNERQVFDIVPYSNDDKESLSEHHCVPETSIHEYHPFLLKSSNLKTVVSKQLTDNYLVGGIPENKNFQELELCIVSSDYGCSAEIKSNCIYKDIDYRFRVNAPVQGYLRVVGNQVEIVKDYKKASVLNLYKEPGWGLRIVHWAHGERQVFSARYKGGPILLEDQVSNAARQWFELIESN